VRGALIILGILVSSGAAAQSELLRFEGGPWDGLGYVRFQSSPSEASVPDTSPVPAEIQPQVQRAMTALGNADLNQLQALSADPNSIQFCFNRSGQPCDASSEIASLSFKEHCRLNSPYYMATFDQSVRIETICDGKLTYLTYLSFADGKLMAARMQSAAPPPVVIRLPEARGR
jgi:hypothetical protein